MSQSLSRLKFLHASARKILSNSSCLKHSVRSFGATSKHVDGDVIFSGIQPTGIPHLGNYLGALRQWVELQNQAKPDTKLLYCIVDLHAITTLRQPEKLRQWKEQTLAVLVACGLDPKRSIIFYQSDVPAHSELMWILSCNASMGHLSRMTQWKSKSATKDGPPSSKIEQNPYLQLGLFSYPVLQAADILVHRATHVPVGDDQTQHLEFARSCATTFNSMYKSNLPVPKTMLSPAMRIMSLKDPHLKMSKSHEDPKSRILLTDPPTLIREKFKVALTDSIPGISYDPVERPGVSNLISILSYLSTHSRSCEEIALDLKGKSLRQLKESVAEAVVGCLAPIQQRYESLTRTNDQLKIISSDGAEKARASAKNTMDYIRRAAGLD